MLLLFSLNYHIQVLIALPPQALNSHYSFLDFIIYPRSQHQLPYITQLLSHSKRKEEEDEAKMGINLYSSPKRLPRQGPRCRFHNRSRLPLLRRPLRPSVGERNLRSSDLSSFGYHIGERGSPPHRYDHHLHLSTTLQSRSSHIR